MGREGYETLREELLASTGTESVYQFPSG
jgi:hypothetical protein